MRQDVYRVAYDEAISELGEILKSFEQLRLRKERVEKAMEVLKPLVSLSASSSATTVSDSNPSGTSPDSAPPAVDPSPNHKAETQGTAVPAAVMQRIEEPISYPAPQASESAADPFQRRINNALRQGFSSGESREFARSFAGGLLRGR